MQNVSVYTVSDITRLIKGKLEREFPELWIEGEISNLSKPVSGHIYFTLKDDKAQLQVAMFRPRPSFIKFNLEDGMKVLVNGRITVYEARGNYQLIANQIEPRGIGALQLAFEKLKKNLAAEGLFSEEHKKELPSFPETIGVITSSTGAAIRDILNILKRRAPRIRVIIYPVRVQGEESAGEIEEGLKTLNTIDEIDVIILARGGGSLEDLWSFNEEIVARAIFASEKPVISAVGHEIDFTISDFVADLRAPTPSAAAELVIPSKDELKNRLISNCKHIINAMRSCISQQKQELENASSKLAHLSPQNRIESLQQFVDDMLHRIEGRAREMISKGRLRTNHNYIEILRHDPKHLLSEKKGELSSLLLKMRRIIEIKLLRINTSLKEKEGVLGILSPYSQIERGYMIARKIPAMSLVKSIQDVTAGERLSLLARGGEINCTIDEITEKIWSK